MDSSNIEALSDAGAQRALLEFWDRAPASLWVGGRPSNAEAEMVVGEVGFEADGDVEQFRAEVVDNANDPLRGAAARAILIELEAIPELQGVVHDSVSAAEEAHLAPIPLIIGAIVFLMSSYKKLELKRSTAKAADGATSTSTEFSLETRDPKELIEGVEAFVKSKLTGLLG